MPFGTESAASTESRKEPLTGRCPARVTSRYMVKDESTVRKFKQIEDAGHYEDPLARC